MTVSSILNMAPFVTQKSRYLLAIDPSLTCSGWALFSLSNERLLGVGKIKSMKPTFKLSHRYKDLQAQIATLFDKLEIGSNDMLVCEAPTTMRDPKAAFKVEQVRGIFETLARQRGALVPGRINPRTVHFEILGLRGKQLKREIVKATTCTVAAHLHSKALIKIGFKEVNELKRHQDIADALLIGSVVLARIKRLVHAKEPLSSLSFDAN